MSYAAPNSTHGSCDKALGKLCKATQLKGAPARREIVRTEPSIQGKGLKMEAFNRPWQNRPLTPRFTLVSTVVRPHLGTLRVVTYCAGAHPHSHPSRAKRPTPPRWPRWLRMKEPGATGQRSTKMESAHLSSSHSCPRRSLFSASLLRVYSLSIVRLSKAASSDSLVAAVSDVAPPSSTARFIKAPPACFPAFRWACIRSKLSDYGTSSGQEGRRLG